MITYQQAYRLCGDCPRCRKARVRRAAGLPCDWPGHGPYWYAFRSIRGRAVICYIGRDRHAKSEEQITAAMEQKRAKLDKKVEEAINEQS